MVDKNNFVIIGDDSPVDSISIKVINKSDNPLPKYETEGSAGMDVKAFMEGGEPIPIMPGKTEVIHTGLYVEIPQGWEIQVRSRSGLAAKHKICVLNSPGTIDSDYRGEIMVILTNLGSENFFVYSGDRIAQLVLSKVTRIHFDTVDNLSDTARGDGGFGSTGK